MSMTCANMAYRSVLKHKLTMLSVLYSFIFSDYLCGVVDI